MVFIKCFPIWLQIGIPKQLGKIHVSSKFQPFSSKNERVAIFFGIYEVSGLKIPRNTAKFRNYESPYFSLKIVKSYQILVKVSQIWLIFISFENIICWTPTFLANFLLEKEKRWKKRKSSLNIIKLSSGQMRNGPTFLEHLFDIKCQISCCN